jgi:hypothetical protein
LNPIFLLYGNIVLDARLFGELSLLRQQSVKVLHKTSMSTAPGPSHTMRIDSSEVNGGHIVWHPAVQEAIAKDIEKDFNGESVIVRYNKYSELKEKDIKLPERKANVRPAISNIYCATANNAPTISLDEMKKRWTEWYKNAEMIRQLGASGLSEKETKVKKIFAFNLQSMSMDEELSFERHQMVKDTVNYLWLGNDKRFVYDQFIRADIF